MAQERSAAIPTWTECQTWAISGESDLSSVAKDNICMLQDQLAGLGHNVSIEKLDVKGQACSYIVFTVNDVTDEKYVLAYSAAIQVWACVNVKMTGDFPVSGIYSLNNMKYVSTAVSGTGSLCLAVTSSGTVTIDRSTMGIERIVSNTAIDQSLSLKVDCTPSVSSVLDALNVKVTYNAMNLEESLNLKMSDTIDFCPALPLLEFPMSVGDNWNVDSTMTVTGKISGIFKEKGLPNSLLCRIDENAAAFNGTLYLQDLTHMGSIPLDQGAFGPISVVLNTSMTCVGVSVADQGCYNKGKTMFDVVESRTGTHIYYSPDTEFITGMMLKPQFDLGSLMSLPIGNYLSPSVSTSTITNPSNEATVPSSTPNSITNPSNEATVPSSTSDSIVVQPSGEIVNVGQLYTNMAMVPTDPVVATNAIENITSDPITTETIKTATTANTVTGGTPQDSTWLLAILGTIAAVGATMGGIVVIRMKKKNGP